MQQIPPRRYWALTCFFQPVSCEFQIKELPNGGSNACKLHPRTDHPGYAVIHGFWHDKCQSGALPGSGLINIREQQRLISGDAGEIPIPEVSQNELTPTFIEKPLAKLIDLIHRKIAFRNNRNQPNRAINMDLEFPLGDEFIIRGVRAHWFDPLPEGEPERVHDAGYKPK